MDDKDHKTKSEILNKIADNLTQIRRFGVKRIGLFGSAVRGDMKGESDVDILVEFEDDSENFSNLVELYYYLNDLLARRIDLVTNGSLSPYLAPYILDEVEYVEASP